VIASCEQIHTDHDNEYSNENNYTTHISQHTYHNIHITTYISQHTMVLIYIQHESTCAQMKQFKHPNSK